MSKSTWRRIRFVKFIPKYHSTFPFRSRVHSKKEDPALSAISVHRKFPVKFKTKTKVFFKKWMRTHQFLCKYCFRITCIFYFVLLYAKTMRPSVKRAFSHISMQWYRKQDVMRAFSAGSFDYKVVSGADIHFLIEKQWIYFLNFSIKSANGNGNDKYILVWNPRCLPSWPSLECTKRSMKWKTTDIFLRMNYKRANV